MTSDLCLTADLGVTSLILALSHTFVETDHEIISRAILLPSSDFVGLISITSERMCMKNSQAYTGKKCGYVNRPSRHDHSIKPTKH